MLKYFVYNNYKEIRHFLYRDMTGKKLDYTDVLNWLAEQLNLTSEKNNIADIYYAFKNIRHTDNDGVWSGGYNCTHYKTIREYDEHGKLNASRVIDYVQWIPRSFAMKPIIVIDSYGRVVNSKDLLRDFLTHKYNATWRSRYFTYRKHIYRLSGNSCYQKGYGWHKYRGNHAFVIGEIRDTLFHEIEKAEIQEEYNVSFKIRKKRINVLSEELFYRSHHCNPKGYGWKRTRKKKQWM